MTGASWPSLFVAALFGLHPLRVESVAWVSERKDVLSAFFGFWAILAYSRYAKNPGARSYAAVLVCFAMSLAAKPMLVTLPFALLLLDFWPLRRLRLDILKPRALLAAHRRVLLEKVPLLVLSVASSAMTIVAQHTGGAIRNFEQVSITTRIVGALNAYAQYIRLTIWPTGLQLLYPLPKESLPLWQIGLAAAVVIGITFVALRTHRRHPYVATGWFWYVGTLVPVIGLVQVGNQAFADRYTYVPCIGLGVMLAWGAPALLAAVPARTQILVAGAGVWLLFLVVSTWTQVLVWRNSETLFSHAVTVTKSNHYMYYLLGVAYQRQGRTKETAEALQASVDLNPDDGQAQHNLGVAYFTLKNY
jgi:protein O-mannosyl-transferase